MAGDPSDVELMLRVKGGDREAFSVLVATLSKAFDELHLSLHYRSGGNRKT